MSNWKKVALGVLTGLGVFAVAHAYGPGNPAQLNAVPPGFTECAVDGGVCKVPAGATAYVVYGTNGKFATAQGTGDFTCLPKGWVATPSASKPQDLGIPDPVPNVQKKCYVQAQAPAPGFSGKGPAGCTDKRCWLEAVDKAQQACKASGCSTCTPNTTASDNCKFENGYTCTSFCKAATPSAPTPAAAPTPPAAAPTPPAAAPAAPQAKMACYWMDSAPPNLWKPSPMPAADQAACKRLDSCSPDGGKASGGGCYTWASDEQVKAENAKKTAAPPPPAISVKQAVYGANCAGKGKPDPNIKGTDPTKHIAAACDGKGTCDYKVDHTAIGDPVFGCRKEYAVQYTCGGPAPKQATVAAEASGQLAKLDCTK